MWYRVPSKAILETHGSVTVLVHLLFVSEVPTSFLDPEADLNHFLLAFSFLVGEAST